MKDANALYLLMKTNQKFKIILTFSPIFTESPLPCGIDTTVGCIAERGY